MITIERLETRVGILPLLTGGKVDVAAFTLVGADVLLERNDAGVGNWELDTGAAPRADGGKTPTVDVRALAVQRASLSYRESPTAEAATLTITSLTLTPTSAGKLAVTAAAGINDKALRIDGSVGVLAGLLDRAPVPFALNLDYGGYGAELDGTLQLLPGGRGIKLTVGGNTDGISGLSGNIGITFDGERPKVSGDLKADRLEPGSARDDAEAGAALPARVFDDTPLPLEALAAADIDMRLAAASVVTATRTLTDVKSAITLADSVLVAGPIEAAYGGGRINALVKLDGSRQLPELDISVTAADVELGRIDQLAALVSGAAASADIALRGRGHTAAAIAASSSGHVRIDVGPGTVTSGTANLLGADLMMQSLRAISPAAGGTQSTELECAVMNFPIRNGIAVNDKGIGIQTSRFVVLGGGNINLKTEQLDLALKPKARKGLGISAASLASLVRLRGTLSEPSVAPDALGVAAAGARVGAAIFTGGLSVLAEGALNKASSGNLAVCDVARGQLELDAAPAPEDASTLDAARSAGGKAVESGRKLLKNLFD
ncbi:MAG: AsmA family protein [Gammaproteobacteria bacterium]|nr:AsmA family protein [Gammaproteobacteria bacterium]